MLSNEKSTQSMWKWENTAHITKMSIEGLVAAASLAGAIAAILIATKVIAGPASLALIANPAGIAVLFIGAVYFAAAAYASYQQMHAKGEKGEPGKDGKDASFADVVKDVIKSGTIVKEGSGKDEKLFLILPIDDYKALVKNNKIVHVLLKNGKVVELAHVAPGGDATEYKVQLTRVGDKDQPADMKAELGIDSKPLEVAVSNEALEALKGKVATNLVDVALENAISNAKKV